MCSSHDHDHKPSRRRFLSLTGGMLLSNSVPSFALANALSVDLPRPGPRDVCPVCGMFVSKYPDWIATVLFHDGYADHFDGAKDFFKYLFDLQKYVPGRKRSDIVGMGVTDYYDVKLIDARQALYVIGSDVYGPMGHEFIPHPNAADADEFNRDHKGHGLVTFSDVTQSLAFNLDKGVFKD